MKKIFFNLLIIIGLASCQKEEITIGTNAADTFFLQEKGNSMPIRVHGNVASKKMLVTVHGGPGTSGVIYRSNYVIENVEKEIAVVYYDQRLAGASEGNATNSEISLYKSDLKKVLQLLKSRYGNDTQFYLMGHSWGGFVGPYFLVDGNNQDLVKGWIQVDGAHNLYKSDSLTKEMLLKFGKKEILENINTLQWQEIVNYCNAHAFNESYDVYVKLNEYAGKAESYLTELTPFGSELNFFKQASLVNNLPLTGQFINNSLSQSRKIDGQTYAIPISNELYKVKIPTLLLWGRYDFICPIGLKDDIKKNIGSKDVTEKVFEKSGHSPMFYEPVAYWKTLVDWVKVH